MIEYMRNTVLVRLAYYANSLRFEGNRRIESKFPKGTSALLESTLQKGHSQQSYAEALLRLAECYIELMDQAVKEHSVEIQKKEREYFSGLLEESISKAQKTL